MQLYQNLLTQAQGVASTPYSPYGGQLVAPVNQQQSTGIGNINANWNAAQPFVNTAQGMAMAGASPITSQQIQQYMSPYTQDVVNATQAQFNNQNQQQQQGVISNAAAQGALGGNRVGITQANLANQQQLAQAPVIANLENQGYQTGLSTALSQQQAQAQGAYSMGNLGAEAQNQALTGANAQVGAGSLEQQTQQAQLAAAYQQWLNQQAYPFQTTQWLAGLGTGVGSQMGGTSSTTGPAPSSLNSWLGLGAAGVGAVGQAGGWAAMAPMLAALARGGKAEGVANQEVNIPETPATLHAQQRQLLRGHRKAQVFPHGTPELGLPPGMARADTDAGAIHYNPQQVDADTVNTLAAGGRVNELLGMGSVNKDEALRRIRGGEIPVAVVERDQHGTEVRAALGTHNTAHHQAEAMHRTKSPEHSITFEHPHHVIAHRLQHHSQGVANRDAGGGVNYQTFGGGFGTPVVPYSGGKGWVPGMGIVHGPGAPRPPSAPNQQSDLSGQMKNIGSMANTIAAGFKGNLGDDGLGNTNDPSWTGGTPLDGSLPIGTGGIGSARRGGVVGYADGGDPSFNDRFSGVDPTLPPTIDGVPTQLAMGAGNFDSPASAYTPPPSAGVAPANFDSRFSGPPAFDSVAQTYTVPKDLPAGSFADTAPSTPPAGVAPTTAPEIAPTEASYHPGDIGSEPPSIAPEETPPLAQGVAPRSGAAPRGIRNNNPGNIEDGAFARSQPGYMGSDGRFAIFKTPEAGANAQSSLLASYGNKGINTLNGIINRWAPAADGNNTQAYIAAVSKMTGLDPNQPLNMADPALRQKIASAIGQYENGAGGTSRDTMLARNYNRASGLAPTDEAALPSKAGLVQQQGNGLGIDLSANSKLWPSLMAAGFGMMASRSPFPGVAIGQGGEQGLQTYGQLRQQEVAQSFNQRKIDLEAQKLSQEADHWSKDYVAKMMPYSGKLTAAQQLTAAHEAAQLEETRRQHDIALHTPVKWSEDRYGNVTYALPRPNPNGGVDYYPIDPNTKEVAKTPAGSTPNPLLQGAPGASGPAPGSTSVATPPGQEGFTPVAQMSLDQAREAAPPPEARAAMPAASPQARNEAYLAALAKTNPQYAANLKAIADYQINPAQLFSLRKNMRANAMGDLFIYDPTYDQRRYNSTNQAVKSFATGKQGDAVRSFSVAIEHLGTAEELGKALDNGNVQMLNSLRNTLRTQFGAAAVPNFDTAKAIVADEIAKAVIGGVNAERDRQGLQDSIKTASSPAQLEGVIHTFKELMGGQVIGYKQQYENSTGLHNFDSMLTPRARLEVSRLSAERASKLQGEALPGAPGATPPVAAASALPQGIPPGSVSGKMNGQPVWRTPDGKFIPKVAQ